MKERDRQCMGDMCVKCSLDSVLTAAGEGEGVQIPIQQNTETADTHTHKQTHSYSPLAEVLYKTSCSLKPAHTLCRPGDVQTVLFLHKKHNFYSLHKHNAAL